MTQQAERANCCKEWKQVTMRVSAHSIEAADLRLLTWQQLLRMLAAVRLCIQLLLD